MILSKLNKYVESNVKLLKIIDIGIMFYIARKLWRLIQYINRRIETFHKMITSYDFESKPIVMYTSLNHVFGKRIFEKLIDILIRGFICWWAFFFPLFKSENYFYWITSSSSICMRSSHMSELSTVSTNLYSISIKSFIFIDWFCDREIPLSTVTLIAK